MATIVQNKQSYESFDWRLSGEEWANAWGGSDMQWYGTVLPRIHLFLPAKQVIEIGAGYGRWANFFQPLCDKLILCDVTTRCVEHCNHIFTSNPKIKSYQTDGSSLHFAKPFSTDFIFSFHSLVWADEIAWNGYVKDISRALTTNGVAFLHHSIAGEHLKDPKIDLESLCDFRDTTMTADKMSEMARTHGLVCSSQEKINWETDKLLDCFSILARPNALWGRSSNRLRNNQFRDEMARWGRLAELYARGQTIAQLPQKYLFT